MFENSTDDLILEKLIVLYTFNNLKEDVTDTQLTQIILGTDSMNYFTLMALLPKMIESKFIMKYKKNNTMLYTLTQSGLEVLIYFQNRIPQFFVDRIDDYIKEHSEEIFSSMIKKQSSYSLQDDMTFNVTLILIKGRQDVMSINVNVESEIEAKSMCHKWESDPEKYLKILEILNS